jgi:hypothetical protein
VQEYVTGPPLNLGEEQVGRTVENAIDELQSNAQNIATRVLSGAAAAGSLLVTALLALVLCFFYLKDGPKFLPWLSGLVGPRAAPHVSALSQRSWVTLSGFIKAQAAVGLVDAVFIGVGLAVLGVPLALPLAVLVFFGAFIPIIGAVFTGILAALVALVTQGRRRRSSSSASCSSCSSSRATSCSRSWSAAPWRCTRRSVIIAVTAGGTLGRHHRRLPRGAGRRRGRGRRALRAPAARGGRARPGARRPRPRGSRTRRSCSADGWGRSGRAVHRPAARRLRPDGAGSHRRPA